jgi:hypothetical protein
MLHICVIDSSQQDNRSASKLLTKRHLANELCLLAGALSKRNYFSIEASTKSLRGICLVTEYSDRGFET